MDRAHGIDEKNGVICLVIILELWQVFKLLTTAETYFIPALYFDLIVTDL